VSAPTRQRVVVVSDLHMAVPNVADRGGAPQYANAGTWSTMVRPGRDGAEDRLRFIEIAHGVGRPATARLRRWQRT
jgi:hypothetical protein